MYMDVYGCKRKQNLFLTTLPFDMKIVQVVIITLSSIHINFFIKE